MDMNAAKALLQDRTFASVSFIKRSTGELRTMTVRGGVRKGLTGTGMKFNPDDKGLIVVWSTMDNGYRMVPADAIVSIRAKGREFIA